MKKETLILTRALIGELGLRKGRESVKTFRTFTVICYRLGVT